jgi:probable phosphoglycerate mutase
MLLHLVRHGETTFNAEGRIQGQSDSPLSDLGRRQGQAVAKALADRPLKAIFSSPLSRARETAMPIAERHALDVQFDSRLMELSAGIFERQLKSDLAVTCPEELSRWLGGDEDFAIPGGESRRQLMQRGCEVLRSIAALGYQEAAIVTHGGLLSTTLRSLLNLSEPLPPFSLKNGSITRLTVDENGRFALVALNETQHLESVGLSGDGDLQT